MIFKPEIKTPESLLHYYESKGNVRWAIYRGVQTNKNDVLYSYIDTENPTDSLNQLKQAVSFIAENESNYNPYTFMSIDEIVENPKKGNKLFYGNTVIFQFFDSKPINQPNNPTPVIINKGDNSSVSNSIYENWIAELKHEKFELQEKLKDAFLLIEELKEEIKELESELQENESNEPPQLAPKDRLINAIAGIAEKPETADLLIGIGANLIGKLMKIPVQQQQQPYEPSPTVEDYERYQHQQQHQLNSDHL